MSFREQQSSYKTLIGSGYSSATSVDIVLGDYSNYKQVIVQVVYRGHGHADGAIQLKQGQTLGGSYDSISGCSATLSTISATDSSETLQDDFFGGPLAILSYSKGSVAAGTFDVYVTAKGFTQI